MKCNFANINVEFDSEYEERFQTSFENYKKEFDLADIKFEITPKDIEFEITIDENAKKQNRSFTVTKTSVLRKIGEKIGDFDGAILHSASFAVDGKGFAFSALSGTGKSTHMFKWQEMLGDRFQIVNGDKPFIRFIDDDLYIYGNPWAGKEFLESNIKVPLKHICQIVRSETNHTEQMPKQEGINLLLNQIYMPFDPMARIKTLQLINRIADSVTFWKISCNMDDDAAEVSYKAIFGE